MFFSVMSKHMQTFLQPKAPEHSDHVSSMCTSGKLRLRPRGGDTQGHSADLLPASNSLARTGRLPPEQAAGTGNNNTSVKNTGLALIVTWCGTLGLIYSICTVNGVRSCRPRRQCNRHPCLNQPAWTVTNSDTGRDSSVHLFYQGRGVTVLIPKPIIGRAPGSS